MERIQGVITSKIKSISFDPILFRFQLTDFEDRKYNMIIHTYALNFFQQAKMGSQIELWSVLNQRKQWVVKRFKVFSSEVLI